MNESTPSPGFKYRGLRIAFSAVCGILCLLLIVLWVRSYQWQDYYCGWVSKSRTVDSLSYRGWISFHSIWFETKLWDAVHLPGWESTSHFIQPDPVLGLPALAPSQRWAWAFHRRPNRTEAILTMPCWFPVLLAATFTAAPWIHQLRWRFSLRTLLIATTLVAALLGTVVWAVR
jgi:hypothetical protein